VVANRVDCVRRRRPDERLLAALAGIGILLGLALLVIVVVED
jgi:hypothetical protein